MKQVSKQFINSSFKRAVINQYFTRCFNQSRKLLRPKRMEQPVYQSISQSINQSTNQTIKINHTIKQQTVKKTWSLTQLCSFFFKKPLCRAPPAAGIRVACWTDVQVLKTMDVQPCFLPPVLGPWLRAVPLILVLMTSWGQCCYSK